MTEEEYGRRWRLRCLAEGHVPLHKSRSPNACGHLPMDLIKTMQRRLLLLEMQRQGASVAHLATQFGMNENTVSFDLKMARRLVQ